MENSPYEFLEKFNINGIFIKYSDLIELGQSGIKIGKISFDNYKIQQVDFGGPLLVHSEYILIPMYKRTFFKSGFILALINLRNFKIFTIGKIKPLIWLNYIDEGKVYFYEDIECKKAGFLSLSEKKLIS